MSAEQNVTEVPVHPASQTSDHGDEESFGGSGGFELDENGQRVPHGMGISKSSRRRRRKRKSKSVEGVAGQSIEGSSSDSGEEGASQAQAVTPAAPPAGAPQQQQGFRQNNQQPGRNFGGQPNGSQPNGAGQNAPGGTKRWKKKFRERDRQRNDGSGQQGQQNAGNGSNGAGGSYQQNGGGFRSGDTHQPGNNAGGFKRKGGFGAKQHGGGGGGSRGGGFVGPMDHSYRVVNGNVFDVSPATIEVHGNGGGYGSRSRSYGAQGDSQPIDYSQGRVVPIAEGTPTKIYFFIDDLFFTAKIQETARKLGVKVAFVKNEKEQIAALTAAQNEDHPGLIVFDLNNANAKPMTLIPKLKAKLKKTTSIIGFLSHLQGDLKAKAVEAGCDTVMPRAAFSQNLPNLLRRYGIEEVDEPNFNQ